MIIHDSHNTLIHLNFDELKLDYFIKMYIKYLSIFNCKDIDIDDKELNKKINDLDKYIKKMMEVK